MLTMPKRGHGDPNVEAARVVAESVRGKNAPPPPDVEAAWAIWPRNILGVDERTMKLLRAAFEAGADAARGAT